MGESKRPIYAYVDETGNTGHNLFDQVQPDFYTAALITRGDFDVHFAGSARAIAQTLGESSLHGKELGVHRIERIAPNIISLLKAARASFFVSRVEKKYLLASKMFDSIFDSGENAGVAWHHYNIKPLRLLLMFKASSLVDDAIARSFWNCVLEHKEEVARQKLVEVCDAMLANVSILPDLRSREVIGGGLEWARDHPESIQIHTDRKLSRQGHFPNIVAFGNLLAGLEDHSKRVKRPVARITHDQQSEFEKTLKAWHDLFSNASPEELKWAGEVYSFQKVSGSTFETKEDSESPGIQIADVVLWLYRQYRSNKPLPDGCLGILTYVFENGWESDFSFTGVQGMYIEKYGPIMAGPMDPKIEQQGRDLIAVMERARADSMAQYEQDRIPPFMRPPTKTIGE